jgi:hypothetical protein
MNNSVIATGGPYANSNNAVLQTIPDINVDGTGCYVFTIYDEYGDGICCSYGSGYYKVYYDNVLIGQGSQFGAEASIAGFGSGCPENEILLKSIEIDRYTMVHQQLEIKGIATNKGLRLTSFDVRYKINDGEFSEYYTKTCNVGLNENIAFTHSVPYSFSETGLQHIVVEIANPNGLIDEFNTNDNIRTFSLIVNSTSVPRTTVLEHFSTESCPNCPAATTNITNWLRNRENIIWVFHHVGYYTDPYTVASVSNPLLVFYNSTGSYAPATMLDRKYYSPDNDPGPIFFPSSSYTPGLLDKARNELSFVSIDFDGVYDAGTRELSVTVDGSFEGDFFEENLRVTIYILEDGLTSTNQSGYNGTYTHNNVIRAALTPAQGDATVISGNTAGTSFNKTYTANINSSWNTENLKIVAFVHNWATDVNDRNILNAVQKTFSEIASANTDILSFAFANEINQSSAHIDYTNKTIDIIVDNTTDLTDLIAEFTLFDGSTAEIGSVAQVSGITANDFSSPLTYTIIASDGVTTEDWVVNVSQSNGNNEADILRFSFGDYDHRAAIINNDAKTINIVTNLESSLTNLVADFVLSQGATAEIVGVDQESGITVNDFSSPVTYVVTAEDGTTTENWTVTVTKYVRTESRMIDYDFGENNTLLSKINTVAKTISVYVERDRNISNLVAEFALSDGAVAKIGEEIQESGVTANNFENPVTYTVVAEDETTTDWTVTVIMLSNEADILSFTFGEDIDFSPAIIDNTNNTIDIIVKQEMTGLTNLIAEFTLSDGAIAKIGEVVQESGVTANNFENPITYTVVAEDETTTNWTVTVIMLSNAADILSFTFGEDIDFSPATINSTNNTIDIIVKQEITDLTSLVAEFTLSEGAVAKIGEVIQESGITVNNFETPVTYIVTAEDGTIANWIATISVHDGIEDILKSSVRIYPNPANDVINITFAEGANIKILNMMGQELINLNSSSDLQKIDISNLTQGVYVVQITKDNNTFTSRITVTK